MSGLEVLGGLSAVISLLDASIKIYDSAQHDIKLSATFEVVRLRLPVLLHTLEICKKKPGIKARRNNCRGLRGLGEHSGRL